MFEHKSQPLISTGAFYLRMLRFLLIAVGVLTVALGIGMLGFHVLAAAPWIDAFHNASMLLSGMGPVISINSYGGKIFSAVYALFSGVVIIGNVGLLLAPAMHRLLHHFHLEGKAGNE